MTNNDIIDTLKQAGFRIRVQHYRYYHLNKAGKVTMKRHLLPTQAPRARMGRELSLMEANGGVTHCLVLMSTKAKNIGLFAEGTAHCATDDPFNRSQGVRFALRDALMNLDTTVDEREHMLLRRSIEQLEQVENEYQEDVRLRAVASEVRHQENEATWGKLRAESARLCGVEPGKAHRFPILERSKRKVLLDAKRDAIVMANVQVEAPEATASLGY